MPDSVSDILICAFYKFHPIDKDLVARHHVTLEKRGGELGLRGLAILGAEGLNATLSGPPIILRDFCVELLETLGIPADFSIKESFSDVHPFRRFKIKVRDEIVTLGQPDVLPLPPSAQTHLSPADFHAALQDDDVVVLDTRNWYETKIGKFKKAIDPHLEEFQEWPEYLRSSGIAKDKKVLIYCTGGIRCEKAIVEMHRQGFEKVYQLDGGILNYLNEYPHHEFEGECFVFDHRVAVDQDLKPSANYKLCPHCGQPGQTTIICRKCENESVVCELCVKNEHMHTCSKNCAHHYGRDRLSRGQQQQQGHRFESGWLRAIK